MQTLPITLGLLTYNSGETLERALKSAPGFAQLVLADGGSTDNTLEIGKRYGAQIVSQSTPNTPITDFARERNILLSAATQPWFLYMDSDEVLSEELLQDLALITTDPSRKEQAYRIRYLKTSEDLTKKYRTFREYYQVRLVRTGIGAMFERAVHERLVLPKETVVGQIEGPWYVLLDKEDLSLSLFSKKAWKRTAITARAWTPKNLVDIFWRVIAQPLREIGKSLVKIVGVRIKWGRQAIPLRYELLRILYSFFLIIRHGQRALGLLSK